MTPHRTPKATESRVCRVCGSPMRYVGTGKSGRAWWECTAPQDDCGNMEPEPRETA